MKASSRQPALFDTDGGPDHAKAEAARAEMGVIIDQLSAADVEPWKDQIGEIMLNGTFRRAMWYVPADEAASLWAEFDVQMDRLCAIWVQRQPVPEG